MPSPAPTSGDTYTAQLGARVSPDDAPAAPRFDPTALRAKAAAVRAANAAKRGEVGPAKTRGSGYWKRQRAQRVREEKRLGHEGYERELRRRLAYNLARRHGESELEARRFSYGHPPVHGCAGRHRRVPGTAACRRRGSRRSTGPRAGPDDGNGDDGPGELAPPSRRRGEHQGEASR